MTNRRTAHALKMHLHTIPDLGRNEEVLRNKCLLGAYLLQVTGPFTGCANRWAQNFKQNWTGLVLLLEAHFRIALRSPYSSVPTAPPPATSSRPLPSMFFLYRRLCGALADVSSAQSCQLYVTTLTSFGHRPTQPLHFERGFCRNRLHVRKDT